MPDVRSIKDQFLVYHLTSVENLDGIFTQGLKPRASLIGKAEPVLRLAKASCSTIRHLILRSSA